MTKFEIKQAKRIRGHDGQGFNATLYIDDVKACFVDDDGWGGGFVFTFLSKDIDANKAMEAKLDEFVLEQYKKENPNKTPKYMDLERDSIVGDLVEDFLQLKTMRARCAKFICFVQPKHAKGAYMTQKIMTNTPLLAQRARIIQEFPDAVFLNDHLEDGKWKSLIKFDEKPE